MACRTGRCGAWHSCITPLLHPQLDTGLHRYDGHEKAEWMLQLSAVIRGGLWIIWLLNARGR